MAHGPRVGPGDSGGYFCAGPALSSPDDGSDVWIEHGHQDAGSNHDQVQHQNMEETKHRAKPPVRQADKSQGPGHVQTQLQTRRTCLEATGSETLGDLLWKTSEEKISASPRLKKIQKLNADPCVRRQTQYSRYSSGKWNQLWVEPST